MSKKENKAFRAWRGRMGLTQVAAADILNLNVLTVRNYEIGKRCDWPYPVIVPKIVLLACSCIENKLPPIS